MMRKPADDASAVSISAWKFADEPAALQQHITWQKTLRASLPATASATGIQSNESTAIHITQLQISRLDFHNQEKTCKLAMHLVMLDSDSSGDGLES